MDRRRNDPMHPYLRPSPAARPDLDDLLDDGIRLARNKQKGAPEYNIPDSDFRRHHNNKPPQDPTHGGQVDATPTDVFGRPIVEG